MKLGNSKGNNTGKKYCMRGRDDQGEPAAANRRRADKFGLWFGENYQELVNFLISKNTYDEDVFAATYLRIAEKLLYTSQVVKDYRAYFHRSYYTNFILEKTKENRYVPLKNNDNLQAHHADPYEKERLQLKLELDIFDYVYERYPLQEFELFKMYISLKPAINYKTLSQITHIQEHNIQRIMSKILADIRSDKFFLDRYREVI